MERIYWSLKQERTNHESFHNLEDARFSAFRYIETFCSSQRLHQTLDYPTPNQFEG